MRSLLALLLIAPPLAAQDNRANDFMLNRMKERLGLSEEQASKVREILAQEAADRQKLDDARIAKIKELLDADQQSKYDEMRNSGRGGFRAGGGPGAPGGPGNFGGGFGRGMGQLRMEDLQRDLSLTDEQVEKIKPLTDEFAEQIRKRMEELRANGFQGLNLAEEMQKGQESIKQLAEKVKGHLNEEQKAKMDAQMERMMNGLRMVSQMMGQRPAGPPAGPGRPSAEERVRRAVEALRIENAEEARAVRELVEKVVRAQDDLEDGMKTLRERLSETARNRELSDAAVEDRIQQAVADRRAKEKVVAELQKQLVDVVTSRQELELMAQGILK
jgi:hypothetical protein